MVSISGFKPHCSGRIYTKLPFHIQRYNQSRFSNFNAIQLVSKRRYALGIHYVCQESSGTKYTVSVGRNYHELRFDDEVPKEPFWLSWMKEAAGVSKSLLAFLREQPSQLKYIEWPSFQSTLKTATLTLVLVALLIVALASVDSALCYMLALLLRRTI